MGAGRYRHPVEIQHKSWVQDPLTGEMREDWTTYARVWAAVEDLSGREFWAAQQVQSEVTTRVRFRYLPGVEPSMRVLHAGRQREIGAGRERDGTRRELLLLCKELVE